MFRYFFSFLVCFFVLYSTVAKSANSNPSPKKITIYWDSSLSMKDKDLGKEIEFLDNYFNNVTNVKVEFISFSNSIGIEKTFQITKSDWSALKTVIKDISYDGVALFENTDRVDNSELNFLFTDGFEVLDKLKLRKEIPTYIINSSKNSNNTLLKEQSFNTDGNYINLNEISIKKALSFLLFDNKEIELVENKEIISTSRVIALDGTSEKRNLVRGVVYGERGTLSGAEILVVGSSIGTATNENGEFAVKAKQGDLLEIRFLGKQTKEILVEKFEKNNILLLNEENNLDEVVVKGSYKEEKMYTGYGNQDPRRLGYTVTSIDAEEITPIDLTVSDAVRGKMLTTTYGQNDDISQAIFRGVNSMIMNQYPLIVINGAPMERNRTDEKTKRDFYYTEMDFKKGSTNKITDYINPNNIANITILRGLAATNRFGSEGNRGVIMITTKDMAYVEENKKPYDQALVRDNDYNENLTTINTAINKKYINELKKQKGVKDQYKYYLNQRNKYLTDFEYFANVSDFFAQMGYKDLSSKILGNILENNSNERMTLKYVAMKAEEKKDYLLAERVYKKIAELKPREAQSYRDLALIYEKTGNSNKALNIYMNIENNKFTDVNFSGLRKNIKSEMKRLILKHKKDLILTGVPADYSNPVNYDARIVFDYNDRQADFEFQFVNPQKKFFTWSHTKEMNASRMYEEKTQGFNTEEFLLINAEKGEWLINIESNIKNNKNPVVVKYTVFKNFGKANETSESKVLLLNNIKGKHILGKVRI